MSRTPEQSAHEVLERTSIMVLSTTGPDGPWSTPVGYQVDGRLHLTFLSMPDTRHVRDLLADPRVSVAIFSTGRDGDAGGNLGLQVVGTAHHTGGDQPGQWWSFTVVPDEVWVFDSRDGDRRRHRLDLHAFSRSASGC